MMPEFTQIHVVANLFCPGASQGVGCRLRSGWKHQPAVAKCGGGVNSSSDQEGHIMPLTGRIDGGDIAEPVSKAVKDILAVGIEYVVADHHPAPAQQIHRHAGPAEGPAPRQLVEDMAPPPFGILDHAQVEGAGEQRVIDRPWRYSADAETGSVGWKPRMAGADHRRIDVETQIPPACKGLARRQIVKKRAIAASDIGDHRQPGSGIASLGPVPIYGSKKRCETGSLAFRRIPEHGLRTGAVARQAARIGTDRSSLNRKRPPGRQPRLHLSPHLPAPPPSEPNPDTKESKGAFGAEVRIGYASRANMNEKNEREL